MSLFKESRTILWIATPLIIGQLGQMLLGLADSLMIARLGVMELAALTLANNIFHVPLVFGIGVMTCITVRTATARGAHDPEQARSICRNSSYLALILGLAMAALTCSSTGLLYHLGQEVEVVDRSLNYYLLIMASLIPCVVGIALKNHADALNRVWSAFWISMGAVLLNILLNWIFIFGKLGFPAMHLEGAGIATLIARIAMVAGFLFWFKMDRSLRDWTPYRWLKKWDIQEIKALLKLGLPSGLQTCTEVTAFVAAGIFIGWFGKEALAAHQIALVCAAASFMIPLGLSIALTMRVGEMVGRKEYDKLKTIFLSGWLSTLCFSVFSATMFISFGSLLANGFIENEPEVTQLAAAMLFVAGIFQIVDGQQIASVAMLRGLEDTKVPALIALFSYWVVGLPFGYWLATTSQHGPVGIWWGLALGLATASLPLSLRLWKKSITP